MRKFVENHEEIFLALAGLLFFSGIVVFAVWGVSQISADLGRALSAGEGHESDTTFHVQDAQKANLRGLSQTGN